MKVIALTAGASSVLFLLALVWWISPESFQKLG